MIPNDRPTVNATETSIQLIEYIKDREGARMQDFINHFDVARSTIHNHLTTLRKHGYISKTGDVYYLGIKLYHIGWQANLRNSQFDEVNEEVTNLAHQTGEIAVFLVEENGRWTVTHCMESTSKGQIKTFPRGYDYGYLHTTASGKAMLAEMPRDRVEEIIDYWGLPKKTEYTITDEESLFNELQSIRNQGYAIAEQEYRGGLVAVGTSVLDPNGGVFGGISIDYPTYQASESKLDKLAEALLQTADRLETKLSASQSESG